MESKGSHYHGELDHQRTCHGETCAPGKSSTFFWVIQGHWFAIAAASIIIICLVFLIWVWWRVLKFPKNRRNLSRITTHGSSLFLAEELDSDVRVFTFEEIKEATKNFGTRIGKGAQGEVFKGRLQGNKEVAVKKSWGMSQSTAAEFCKEITILSKIRHEHIVVLHGYCLLNDVAFLVYDFLPNGNLYSFMKDKNNRTPWFVRLAIAIKVASGLVHLHSERVMHRDIKPLNILLDEDFEPIISDFGISKLTPPNEETHGQVSLVKGTPGYMCPEYTQDCRYEISCDTFSFGVVLAELISGKTALFEKDGEILALWEYFKEKSMIDLASCLDEQVEPADKEILSRAASIACDCMQPTKAGRPPMHLVLEQLQDLQEPVACDNQQLTTTSENAPMLEHPV